MNEEKPQIEEEEEVPEKIKEPITKKDPKKVEQGKRLAAISKQAKEEKMRRKIKEEDFSYLPYIIYPIAFLSSAGFMYLLLFGKDEAQKEEVHYPMTIIRESPKKASSPKKEIPRKFEGFD